MGVLVYGTQTALNRCFPTPHIGILILKLAAIGTIGLATFLIGAKIRGILDITAIAKNLVLRRKKHDASHSDQAQNNGQTPAWQMRIRVCLSEKQHLGIAPHVKRCHTALPQKHKTAFLTLSSCLSNAGVSLPSPCSVSLPSTMAWAPPSVLKSITRLTRRWP